MAEGDFSISVETSVLYRPSTAEVAAELPGRALDGAGNPLPDFTTQTEPTAEQVEQLIDQATRDVWLRIGDSLDSDDLIDAARLAATRRAAMLVELRYFRREVNAGRSSYQTLKELYDDDMRQLERAVKDAAAGGDPGVGDDSVSPSGCFPAPSGVGTMAW